MQISYSQKEYCFVRHVLDISAPPAQLARPEQVSLIDATIGQHKIPVLMALPGFGKTTLVKQWLAGRTERVVWLRPTPTGSTLDIQQPLRGWLDSCAQGLDDLRELAKPLRKPETEKKKSGKTRRPLAHASAISDPIIVVLESADQLPIEVWLLVQKIQERWPEACQFIVCADQHLHPSQTNTLSLGMITGDRLRFGDSEVNQVLKLEYEDAAASNNGSTNVKDNNSAPQNKTAGAANKQNSKNDNPQYFDPELITRINGWPLLTSGLAALKRLEPGMHAAQQTDRFASLCYDLIEHELLSTLGPGEYTLLEYIEHLPYMTQPLAFKLWPRQSTAAHIQNLTYKLLIQTHPRTGQITLTEPWLEAHFHGRIPKYETMPEELLDTAAQWYEEQEHIGFALSCLVQLQKWDKVAALAEEHAEALAKGNDWQRVTRWLERLPQDILAKHPRLMSLLAWQSISLLRKTMATDYISRASAIERPSSLRQQPSSDNLSLIHKLQRVDVEAEIENLEDLSESLSTLLEKKSHDQRHFLVNTMAKKSAHSANLQLHLQALQHFCNWEFAQSIKICNRLIKHAMAERNATLALNGLYLLAWALHASGDHRSLPKQAHNVSQWLSDNQFEAHPLAVWAQACTANSLRESDQLGESEKLVQLLERHYSQPDAPLLHKYTTWMLRALQNRSLGQITAAQDFAERADAIAHQLPIQFTQTVMSAPALRADILILQERYEDAKIILDPLVKPYWQDAPEQHDAWAIALHSLLLGLAGDLTTMETNLKLLIQFGSRRKHRAFELNARSLLCVGYFRLNEHKKARHALKALLKQLDGSTFKRLLLDRGKHMGNLLLKTGEKHSNDPLLIPWLEQLPHESYGDTLHYDFIKLSKREIEILSLIAQGKSNEEISQALCRSLGTVKLHVHNIYKKLGVSSRIQAIQKCEACGFDTELLS